jgi:multiple sugar transport system permease protein
VIELARPAPEAGVGRPRRTMRRRANGVVPAVLLILILALFLVPVAWTVETALKTKIDAWTLPPQWIFVPHLDNFGSVLFDHGFAGNLVNSAIVATGTTIVALVLGSLAAYGLERFRFRGKTVLFFAILVAYMVPEMSIALPVYVLAAPVGLTDTYALLIVMHATFATAFATWMMRGFFAEVSPEIEEAALVDGASRLGVFRRIALPLSAPGLVATAVFCVIFSWNDFPYALALSGVSTQTLPLAVGTLKTPAGTAWGQIMAITVIAFLPTTIFAILVQRWLIRGLTFGSVK